MPIGTIVIRQKAGEGAYRFIKTTERGKWISYSKYLWTMAGGKIKAGEFIHHKDGNSLNDSLDNYIAVNRAAHCKIHNPGG